jgi:hypothetical protein
MLDKFYEGLAHAIVVQAVEDYELLIKTNRDAKPQDKYSSFSVSKNEIESFFHSKWYAQLTPLDPDYLIRKIKEYATVPSKRRYKAKQKI